MIDQDLQNAYEQAIYRIFKPPISWKVGKPCPKIDELLQQHDLEVAAFVTACNPGSRLQTADENQQQTLLLEQTLRQFGYLYLSGQGEDPQGDWPAEASFLVLGMDSTEARLLGKQFGQNAVLLIRSQQAVQLIPV